MSDAVVTDTSPGARSERHELPFVPASNRAARVLLAAFLHGAPLPPAVAQEVAQDAAIVIGELVANGLDHGRPDARGRLEVSWQLDSTGLRLSVADGGGSGTTPHLVAAAVDDSRGRGLAMVQALSTAWWVDTEHGTRVSAVLPVTGPDTS